MTHHNVGSSSNGNFDTLVIANPQSAGGALARKWHQIRSVIQASFGDFAHRFTERAGDATRIAREALQQGRHQLVVAMGGDGTISEVVDGFFTEQGPVNPEAAFGVLHFGTGGDFRKTIHAAKQLALGAAQLRGRETSAIDVGRLAYTDHDGTPRLRHYVNIASFGISGLVDRYVNESSKRLGGTLTFALATLKAMRSFTPQRARLTLDERAPREVTLHTVAVANGQFFGGGMQIAPRAKLDDGLFDVILLEPFSTREMLLRGHRVYRGKHLDLDHVSMDRARRVVAEPLDPDDHVLLDVDGETPGRLPATFELLPGALRLKVPRAVDERAQRCR